METATRSTSRGRRSIIASARIATVVRKQKYRHSRPPSRGQAAAEIQLQVQRDRWTLAFAGVPWKWEWLWKVGEAKFSALPFPIQNLRHVDAVFNHILLVIGQLVPDPLLNMGGFGQSPDARHHI